VNIDWKVNNILNKKQELMRLIYGCVSYLNTEVEKRSTLLNDKELPDILNYIGQECHSHYSQIEMELSTHKHTREYKLHELCEHIKSEHIWGYLIK